MTCVKLEARLFMFLIIFVNNGFIVFHFPKRLYLWGAGEIVAGRQIISPVQLILVTPPELR